MIRDGAKVDALSDGGITPLVAAVQGNYINAVKVLVQEGKADINKPTISGVTPLMQACLSSDSVELVQYLVEERGAAVDTPDTAGSTALFHAARSGNLRAAEILLNRGANVDHQNKRDVTPMLVAVANCHLPVIDLFHRHDAQLSLADLSGNTPLHVAAMCGHVKAVVR